MRIAKREALLVNEKPVQTAIDFAYVQRQDRYTRIQWRKVSVFQPGNGSSKNEYSPGFRPANAIA
jgi:hypothetical protein